MKKREEPWEAVGTREREPIKARVIATTKSVAQGIFLGFIPTFYCSVAQLLPAKATHKMIQYCSRPWELVGPKGTALDKVMITGASFLTSFAAAYVASKVLPRSVVGGILDFGISKVAFVRWLQSCCLCPENFSRAIMCLSIPAYGYLIEEQGVCIHLSREAGAITDYYTANLDPSIYININREFLEMYPLKVFELYGANLNEYFHSGNHIKDREHTNICFKGEKAGDDEPGPRREFFYLLMKGLIQEQGRSHNVLGYTDGSLKQKGCHLKAQQFYITLGLVFGAMARSSSKCGLGSILEATVLEGVLVPNRFELRQQSTREVLMKIARVLYKNRSELLTLLEKKQEGSGVLLTEPQNIFNMAVGMKEFYSGASFSWTSLRMTSSVLIEKIIGTMDRNKITKRIELRDDENMQEFERTIIKEKIGWLKEWIEGEATDEQVKDFLLHASAAPTIVVKKYVVLPMRDARAFIGFISCTGYIRIPVNAIPKKDFIEGVVDTISELKRIFSTK